MARPSVSKEIQELIKEHYNKGDSFTKIAKLCFISPTTVKRYCMLFGLIPSKDKLLKPEDTHIKINPPEVVHGSLPVNFILPKTCMAITYLSVKDYDKAENILRQIFLACEKHEQY